MSHMPPIATTPIEIATGMPMRMSEIRTAKIMRPVVT